MAAEMKTQFLKDVSDYLHSRDGNNLSMLDDEKFVDDMVEKYKLDDEGEAMLCVAVTYLRCMAVLIK